MIVDSNNVPVEFSFAPGSHSDIRTLKNFEFNLPPGSTILGDRAYTDYRFEDDLLEILQIKLLVRRKKNLKRQNASEDEFFLSTKRNAIETVFSAIVSRMPRHIRARTEKGFCLKVLFFILAYMINL